MELLKFTLDVDDGANRIIANIDNEKVAVWDKQFLNPVIIKVIV